MWEWIIAGAIALVVLGIAAPFVLRALRFRMLLDKYRDEEIARAIIEKRIVQDMTREQLIDSWGNPRAREERVTKTRVVEVFKYRPFGKGRFRDKVTIVDGVVTGWDQKEAP